jgi:hypothetical protein
LVGLQGKRDAGEILPVLEAGLRDAPDDLSARQLSRWTAIVRAAGDEDIFLGPKAVLEGGERGVPIGGPQPEGPLPEGGTPDTTTPDTGTTEPGTSQPDTTEPATVRPPADVGADIATFVAHELADHFGVDVDFQRAAELGSQLGGGGGFGGDGSTGFHEALGKAIGAGVGALIGLPNAAELGMGLGGAFGKAIDSSDAAGDIGDALVNIVGAVACLLCGPHCIPCMLTAETVGGLIVHSIVH